MSTVVLKETGFSELVHISGLHGSRDFLGNGAVQPCKTFQGSKLIVTVHTPCSVEQSKKQVVTSRPSAIHVEGDSVPAVSTCNLYAYFWNMLPRELTQAANLYSGGARFEFGPGH
jgi:hypothetical protein